MKVRLEEDRHGRQIFIFPKSATPSSIYQWLFDNGYQDYNFCIMFYLEGQDYNLEWEEETLVYFADAVLEETATMYDYDLLDKRQGAKRL